MRNLLIFGDNQFAERISKYIILEGRDKLLGFTQERQFISRNNINGYPVIPFEELRMVVSDDFEIILGIGYAQLNAIREKVFHKCKNIGYKIANYISTRAMCYSDNIGDGNFISPGVLIGPDCIIGDGNFLASCAILSHDNKIGNYNFISTNVVFGGFANVEDRCFFGLNSTVKDNVTIAADNLIGSAANVLKSISYRGGGICGKSCRSING